MAKLTKENLFNKAQERFNSWAKMYSDPNVTAKQMYEDMSCSCYSGDTEPDIEEEHPVLDPDFCFKYKGYDFELSSCNNITTKEQIIGLTDENFNQHFPHGIFTDRYVCWIYGHKNAEGLTKEESYYPNDWSPEIYLVPGAWAWGAIDDLKVYAEVDKSILEAIDKFLETFNE